MTEKKQNTEKTTAPKSAYAVVGNDKKDPVSFAALVYENPRTRKSLSIHHLQRRLVEWGYGEAGADIDGYYSTHTQSAIESFKADQGIDEEGLSIETVRAIFQNDSNVEVVA